MFIAGQKDAQGSNFTKEQNDNEFGSKEINE